MDDELVKRLRKPVSAIRPTISDGRAAADRIEALEVKLARAVKPLSWGKSEKSGMNLQADCAFGRYYISLRGEYGWMWWRPASGPAHMGVETTEDQAKAAAQEDYERRILSALAKLKGENDG